MQALTSQTVFPCYAAADREFARALADFLERGADVRVFLDDGEIRPGEDLVSKARDARAADIVLVLFSRDSWAARRPRAEWEDALVHEPAEEGVRIAFLRVDECAPPKVLAPQFTARQLRELKRWVRGHDPDTSRPGLESLAVAVADRPGIEFAESADLAAEFAREFRQDFDGVFTLQCGGRSLAALAGDLGAQLGLRLEGPLDENLDRLRDFCAGRRFLILFEDAPEPVPPELLFGGRCSILAASDARSAAAPDPIRDIQSILANSAASWAATCAAARQARRLLRDAGRIAELYEIMRQWRDAAEDEEDPDALYESARELVWIVEAWGRGEEARAIQFDRDRGFDDQLLLPFG